MIAAARPVLRPLLVLAALATFALAWAAPALAHTELRASTPEEGSTVDQLSELRLEFTSDLLDIGAELTVVDADGAEHELDPQFPSSNAVTGTLDAVLPAGETELVWRIVAEDGHPIEGVVAFTYAPAEQPEAPQASPSEPAEIAEPSEPAASATPAPSDSAIPDEGDSEDMPGWVLPLLGLIAAGGAATAILVAKARR